ncbi:A-kinase anchor protein 13 isoform X1 [Pangasianodon hypophthalmus]|uniref:A-kinase anchor protein 13 isoform X1 n=1 Tax=Pangasianodon hypophthalmus TaxID=310915 RepID=UPI0023077EA5|nr:A-kinase anchor protein 13 isoform X1 [Pangasianodon hypophthalmus]XP_026786546.3 A-kinase anchor protein 13 isoform X1 [Pangasianodon hypophthalmus]
MKLNPRQAPLYGSCVLTVQLSNDELCEREDLEFFLHFTGSTQRHVSSTLKISHDTLQLVCPAHDRCESVVVTLCSRGPDGLVHHLSSEQMCFVQDLALDMAQFLVSAVGQDEGTEGALLLNECHIPLQECEKMDQSLALAFKHLTLPPDWSVLGGNNDLAPQETLLHFAARRGLQRVASFLLQQPGARQALALPNREGATPATLAQSCGHSALLELLTQEETGTQDSTETHRRLCSGACVVQHHPDLNTYTLSAVIEPGTTPHCLISDVQDLHSVILQNTAQVELPHIAEECAADPEVCFEQSQGNSVNTTEEEFVPVCEKTNKNEHPGPPQCREDDGDRCLSAKAPESLSDNGNCDEERACSSENIDQDYGAQAESVAAGILGDSSDSLQNSSEGESAAPSCGKEQEETDRAQDLVCEARQSTEEPEREVQEEGRSLLRADEDQSLELSESAAGDMGITQSADTPESSDVGSCSQRDESRDESEVGNGDSSSLEQEEMEGINEDSAMDQSGNDEQESNKADLQSASPLISADMIHPVDDKHEINATQPSDSYELGPKEQEKTAEDNTDTQEEDTLISHNEPETENSHEQSDTMCYPDSTPKETCQKNDTVGELQMLLDAETNQCSSGFELDDTSSVTLDTISQNSTHLPEPEPETPTGEPDSTVISETTAGSESEGQTLACSTDVSLAALGSEPESSTPSSEDTLKPEETERVSANMVQRDSSSDQQEVSQQNSLTCECEHTQVSEDRENRISLENDDRTEEISLKNGDGLPETSDVDLLKNSEFPDQEDRAASPNNLVSEETVDLRTTEDRLIIIEEEVQACLDHSESVLRNFSTSSPSDIVDGSVSLDEQSRLRSEDSDKPEVVDTDSAVTKLTEAKETQEVKHEEDIDGHIKAHQEELDVSLDNQVDLHTERCPRGVNTDVDVSMIHREGHSLCLDNSTHSRPLEKRHSSASTESPRSPARHSTGSTTLRDSGSDTDGFISTDTGEDSVFRKGQEVLAVSDSASEVSVSCSSTDDTTSLCQPSSSAESSEEVRRRAAGAGGGEAEEEAKDRVTEVLLRSSLLRSSVRSQSPFRRHSWGPGKNQAGEGDMNQRSSLRSTGDQKPIYHRRSLSWCPTEIPFSSDLDEISQLLSYSLEGLAAERDDGKRWQVQGARSSQDQQSEDTGSQVSLTEEGQDSDLGDSSSLDSQKSRRYRPFRRSCKSMTLPLRESVSMLSISQRDIDAVRSCGSTSNSLAYSITEEEPGPLRGDFEGKIENKVSRTFSYLKSKMYKKSREKDKEKSREKEAREKEKKAVNGHLFSSVILGHAALCQHCNKTLNVKDTFSCTVCSVFVHKSCRDSIPACTKGKFLKQPQIVIPESTTMSGVTLRTKTSAPRERPWSAILSPDDHLSLVATPRRHTSIMPFNSSNLSKSMSISNIAAFDEMPLKNLRYLSQSTDNLHKANKVNESTESLIDEGTEIDGQLMGEFEADAKELEADSWSLTADKKYLKQLKKDVIKQQDVIYELIQTEMHHVRTLRIMADVYSKGLLKEVQLEAQTVDKVFPVLDDLLEMHTHFFSSLLERRREAKQAGKDGAFAVHRIGDILVKQFSGSNAESMKKVYGKFCSRHNEAVNMYKELHTKDKRFQTFIRKKMSSSIVRRLGIPECILLVTQRLTKYPVLLQRILQHTKDNEEEYENLTQALQLIKDVIAAVDNKVNKHEKKKKLEEIYNRTDGRTITRMKSGQMFAREDLIRGRKLLHDGPLQLKTMAGRLKDVQALLLTDVLIFLQEKDQKYVFASLDQRATVIPLQKLIVREVANEDRGFFIIAAGIEQPEMVEVHATSRDERNTWMQLIQSAMQSREKDDDEGIPSETEEDKKLLESKAKEMRAMLQRKDDQILALLNEKIKLFHDMCGSGSREDTASAIRMLFRACNDDMPKGENIMKEAIREVEMLQTLVHSGLGGAVSQQGATDPGNTASVLLPRRSETFGGFDSHQMNSSKHGDKEEVEDLRRTESDSVLKKGGNTNLLLVLKRNREQVLSSVTHLHALLSSLQALVVQQDTFLEEQRQAVSERPSSRPSSRPPSLVEQEKQRSAERQRQEAAAHAEERKRREKEWEARDKELSNREQLLNAKEEEAQRRRFQLEDAQQELQSKKEDYQKDLERLRDAQRRLEREKEQMKREMEMLEQLRETEKRVSRTLSSTSEDSLNIQSSSSVEQETKQEKDEGEQSTSPGKNSLSRIDSRQKGRNLNAFNPFAPKVMSAEGQKQIPNRLLQLARPKEKKDKKKKKSKSKPTQEAESHLLPLTDPPLDGEIFC